MNAIIAVDWCSGSMKKRQAYDMTGKKDVLPG